jgi:hypothetical protein
MRVGLRRNDDIRMWSGAMMIWLLLVLEFGLVGVVGQLIPVLGDLANPSNVLRHGVVVPFTVLGGLAILHLWEHLMPIHLQTALRNRAYPLLAGVALVVVGIGLAFPVILDVARPMIGLPSETITRDEIAAMRWVQANTSPEATVYSTTDNAWLPVYSERQASVFHAKRYFEWDDIEASNGAPMTDFDYIITSDASLPDGMTRVFEQGNVKVYSAIDDES